MNANVIKIVSKKKKERKKNEKKIMTNILINVNNQCFIRFDRLNENRFMTKLFLKRRSYFPNFTKLIRRRITLI